MLLPLDAALAPLVHLGLVIVEIHEDLLSVTPYHGMDLVPFELVDTILVPFEYGLVDLVLILESLFELATKQAVHALDGLVDRLSHLFGGRVLVLQFLEQLKAHAGAVLELLEAGLEQRVIVEKCLLEILDGGQVESLDVAGRCVDRLEVVALFDVLVDQAVVYS